MGEQVLYRSIGRKTSKNAGSGLENNKVISSEALLQWEFGRLRDASVCPDGNLYILTSNRDGRGQPEPTDDRVLRIILAEQVTEQQLGTDSTGFTNDQIFWGSIIISLIILIYAVLKKKSSSSKDK